MKRYIVVVSILFVLLNGCSEKKQNPFLINEPIPNNLAGGADYACYYKETPQGKLEINIFYPDSYDPERGEPYPAVVNFCGGGWVEADMEWTRDNARYMAGMGFIGIGAQYRLADFKTVSVMDLMMDANSAVRWARIYAKKFNIDPKRIAAMGDSAGGHLALSTAMFPQYKEEAENAEISSIPNVVFTVAAAVNVDDGNFRRLLIGRAKAVDCSPYQNVRKGLPPVFMTQCVEDDILPFRYTEDFVGMMKDAGNTAMLYPIAGGSHLATWEDPGTKAAWQQELAGAVKELGWGFP